MKLPGFLAAVAAIGVLLTVGVTAAGNAFAGGSGEPPPPLSPPPTDAMRLQMAAAQAELDRGRADRATPEARAERVRSRSAYRGLGSAQALALARAEFGQVFGRRAFQSYSPPPGLRVARLIGDEGALLEGDTAEDNLLVEAIGFPFTSTVGSGERKLLDFALQRRPGGFVPRNPAVATHVGDDGVVTVERAMIRVAGATNANPPAMTNERLFYANALRDLDLSITPVPVGVEFAFQVRSDDAQEAVTLEFDAAGAVSLAETPGRPETIGVAVDGLPIGRVAPPAAWDADGEPVPVAYDVEGSRLKVTFPHRGRDVHYPLYVDPVYEEFGESFGRVWDDWTSEASNWSIWTASSNTDGRNWVQNKTGYWFWGTDYARRLWLNPRGYIKTLGWYQISHTGAVTCANAGIMAPGKSGWKATPWSDCRVFDSSGWLNPSSETADTRYQDYAALGMYMNGQGTRHSYATTLAYGAIVGRDDAESPVMTSAAPTTSSGWVTDSSQARTVSARDVNGSGQAGTGIHHFAVRKTETNGGTTVKGVTLNNCNALRTGPCPYDSTRDISWTLDEGINRLQLYASDGLDKKSTAQTWTVRVDRGVPTISLAGSLWDGRADGPTPRVVTGGAIDAQNLSVVANDPGSGVERIDVRLDGSLETALIRECDPVDGCPPGDVPFNWYMSPAEYVSGDHKVTVSVKDFLGKRTEQSFWINTHCR